jgi:low temperature requirement protein LtrA
MATPTPRFTIRTRMTARDTDEGHRTSSPLEALYDLTFVVAIAQVADRLAADIQAGRLLVSIVPFAMVFFAIWWAWMNFTWFASAYDTDDVPYRLLALLQMGGVLVLAAGVPAAFEHQNFFGITLGYFIMRIGLVAQWVRASIENPDGRATARRYAIGVTVVQLGWLSRLLFPIAPADQWWSVYVAFVVLVILELLVPFWAELPGMTTWHPGHIAERYGLFAIILLGETIAVLASGVSEVVAAGGQVGTLIVIGVSALVLIFGLWWLYFLQPAGAGLEANRGGAFFWGYTHYFVFAALGALGASLDVVVRFAGGHLHVRPEVVAFTAAVPVALYLVALLVAHVRILPGIIVHVRIMVPTAVIVLVLPILTDALGLTFVFSLLALVIAAAVAATLILGRHTETRKTQRDSVEA